MTKIILDDGREFVIGQDVEWFNWNNQWAKARFVITWDGSCETIGADYIIQNPSRVRHIAPPKIRPMTAKEVWSLLQTGVEWKYENWTTVEYAIGASVAVDKGVVHIDGRKLSHCTYRTSPYDPWQKFEVAE